MRTGGPYALGGTRLCMSLVCLCLSSYDGVWQADERRGGSEGKKEREINRSCFFFFFSRFSLLVRRLSLHCLGIGGLYLHSLVFSGVTYSMETGRGSH
ncbi:hypothetical protein F4781DRAFT_398269 [Annulohypoxylon bovei var. microspora]|nr:hypothetical protein F4781DRAFT_398269 [Annulohypoxylon bovei var. microspora]